MKHGRKLILMPQALDGENPEAHTPAQETIITALARAFAWSEMLERGEVTSISDLARRLEVDSSYIDRVLRLATLAPDIIKAILQGQEPNGLSLARLTKTLSEDWAEPHGVFLHFPFSLMVLLDKGTTDIDRCSLNSPNDVLSFGESETG